MATGSRRCLSRATVGLGLACGVALFACCPAALAAHPSRAAYVVDYAQNQVFQYTISPAGALSPDTPAAVATGTAPYALALSPDGKSAYVVNYNDSTVSQYNVAANGTLSPKSPATVNTGVIPLQIATSPNGRSVYVVGLYAPNHYGIAQYNVAANGTLSPKTPAVVAKEGQANDVAVSADSKSVYVVNELGNTVDQYNVAANGTLSPKSPASVATGPAPLSIALGGDGKGAYVVNSGFRGVYPGGDSVSQYTIAGNGTLHPDTPASVQAGSPYENGGPIDIATTPDGKSAYVVTTGVVTIPFFGSVLQFTIGSNEKLSYKNTSHLTAGLNSEAIAVNADSRNAYVLNSESVNAQMTSGPAQVSQYTAGAQEILSPMTPPTVDVGTLLGGISPGQSFPIDIVLSGGRA